ncbi:unnamed protein product [Rhizophagus irregularis]|nr:unnamed protein product [Rhizophagus irregularis]
MGRRGDAIIRKCSGGIRHEFGGSEVGSHYKECGLGLGKNERYGNGRIYSWRMIVTLDLPAGYIQRLFKSDLYSIPEDIESFNKALVCWLNLSYLTETSRPNHGIITGQLKRF